MIVDRIVYKKIFPLGSYTTEHIGLEASLSETDNPQTELEHLKQMVNELHSATVAGLEEFRGVTERIVNPIDTTIQGIIEDIGNCTEVYQKNGLGVQTGLVAYEEATKKFHEIKAAYDLKMLQLTKNQ